MRPTHTCGPDGYKVLVMEDGVRQGDATSSYFFCIGVDDSLQQLVDVQGYRHTWMYCDDLNIVVPLRDVDKCIADVTAAFYESARVSVTAARSSTRLPSKSTTRSPLHTCVPLHAPQHGP